MYKIKSKIILTPQILELKIEAPLIAKNARAGQFVILMTTENGERVPFTLADWNAEEGTIDLVIQTLGKTSEFLMRENLDSLPHVAGPLGEASKIDKNASHVVFTGGGLGIAALYPILKEYHKNHIRTTTVVGFRSENLIFWEEKLRKVSDKLIITTDDGSKGMKGRVTDGLIDVLKNDKPGLVYAIGPLPMMRGVALTTKDYNARTIVSLNPIMVDGIGMCGACRVTVNGETKYACVQGPEFDAHQVDFDELILKNSQFKESEEECYREYVFRNKKS